MCNSNLPSLVLRIDLRTTSSHMKIDDQLIFARAVVCQPLFWINLRNFLDFCSIVSEMRGYSCLSYRDREARGERIKYTQPITLHIRR